jgi:thiol-disulfide isomerase/thioredoxin
MPTPRHRPANPENAPAPAPPRSGPSKSTLVRGLFQQEIGALSPGPALDDPAPDFTLRTVEGDREVTLSDLIGEKPVVLVFGNFTCGPFRAQGGNVQKLYERYKDRAHFLMVYVREAHPTDGWHMPDPAFDPSIPQPRTDAERRAVAETCRSTLGFAMPFLVDTIDDAVGGTYSGMPSRLYLIDPAGTVAYKSGRGPFGFKPAELEQALVLLLAGVGAGPEAAR